MAQEWATAPTGVYAYSYKGTTRRAMCIPNIMATRGLFLYLLLQDQWPTSMTTSTSQELQPRP